MPKARAHQAATRGSTGHQKQRRKSNHIRNGAPIRQYQEREEDGKNTAGTATQASGNGARTNASTRSGNNTQGLIMPILVAFVCFGLAVALALFSTDPNRYLFSGLAILMGCMWSYMFWVRLQRLRRR